MGWRFGHGEMSGEVFGILDLGMGEGGGILICVFWGGDKA